MAVRPTNLTEEEKKQGYRVIEIEFRGKKFNTYHCNECQYDSQYLNEPNPGTQGKTRMGIMVHIKKGVHVWGFEDPDLTLDGKE